MNIYLFRGNYVHKIKGTREVRVFPVRHDDPYAVLELWDLALQEAEIRRPKNCRIERITIMDFRDIALQKAEIRMPKDCWIDRIKIMEVYPSES